MACLYVKKGGGSQQALTMNDEEMGSAFVNLHRTSSCWSPKQNPPKKKENDYYFFC
jgi:hypothetical protein